MNQARRFLIVALSLLLLVPSNAALSQQPIRVTFVLTSPDLPDNTAVYITGGVEQLGMWNPGKVLMEPKGNHTWTKEIQVPGSVSIEYKYTLGTWEREGADATGSPLKNLVANVSGDTTIKDSILFWTKGGRKKVIQGQITGTVKYHRAMKGAGLQDRDIIVWLPPNYESNTNARYPVVYMHDGQNIIDPTTSSFGVDWSIDETADRLIKEKKIPPVIIVGIYNTSDRTKEYTPGERGTAYMKFVANTVKPLIDSIYRTKPDRLHTVTGGSSAGGIISFMLVWEYPNVFSKAICMSPAFKAPVSLPNSWDYGQVVRTATEIPKSVFFYIDNGGVGLESQLQPGIDEMINVLKARGYVEGKDFVFVRDAEAKHFEADWAKRLPEALKLVLKE
jgi:predicted alpha/beta superfamily hydrolase